MHDLVIIGSGPAGMTAGIYSAIYKLDTLVIGEKPGGYASDAYKILNYPGLPDIGGTDLMQKFRAHLDNFKIKQINDLVTSILLKNNDFEITTKKNKYFSKTIILASGSERKKLHIPGEIEFTGKGVAYCATCDAFFFKDKITAVIGGSDTAITSALQLTDYAKKVYIIFRKDKLSAMPEWIEKASNNKKITFISNTNVKSINGGNSVESIELDKEYDSSKTLKIDGVFIEIGSAPLVTLVKNIGIKVNDKGFVIVEKNQGTNIKGFFAAGDVTTGSNGFEQIITASAEGAIAANSAFKYIQSIKNLG